MARTFKGVTYATNQELNAAVNAEAAKRQGLPAPSAPPLTNQPKPVVASSPMANLTPISPSPELKQKMYNTLTSMNISPANIGQQNEKTLLEATLTPQELATDPYYQYVKQRDEQMTGLGQTIQNTPEPSAAVMRPLEEALKTKIGLAKEELGQSELFKQSGIDPFMALSQSLAERGNEMKSKYGAFATQLAQTGETFNATYSNALKNYKMLTDQYDKEVARIDDIVKQQAVFDQALTLENARLANDKALFQWKLANPDAATQLDAAEKGYDIDEKGNIKEKSYIPSEPTMTMNIGGKNITAQNSFLNDLAKADEAMFNATGKHLSINQSFRTSDQQKALYDKLSKTGARVAAPGTSFHEKGLAVDITNWQEAKPYLEQYGIINGLSGDMGHFSRGEMNPEYYKTQGSLGELGNAFNTAMNSLKFATVDQAKTAKAELKLLLDSGDVEGAREYLITQARNAASPTQQDVLDGKENSIVALKSIKQKLKEFEEKGGNTNIFTGLTEKALQKGGLTSNPTLAGIANEIAIAIIDYRRAVSGAAFTESEAKAYENVFPSIGKTSELNEAKISSLIDKFTSDTKEFYKRRIGEKKYETIFEGKTSQSTEENQPNVLTQAEELLNRWLDDDRDIESKFGVN